MCAIEGCERPIFSREWCQMHYTRWRRHGDPLTKKVPPVRPAIERFRERIVLDGDCWIWQGGKNHGYGAFDDQETYPGRRISAHRWSYQHFIGPIPEGMHLDHFVCERPACVNPNHVRPVTPRENSLRSDGPAARNRAKTHCPQGHPYDETNTYVNPRGQRLCRTCGRVRDAAYKEKKREARSLSLLRGRGGS